MIHGCVLIAALLTSLHETEVRMTDTIMTMCILRRTEQNIFAAVTASLSILGTIVACDILSLLRRNFRNVCEINTYPALQIHHHCLANESSQPLREQQDDSRYLEQATNCVGSVQDNNE